MKKQTILTNLLYCLAGVCFVVGFFHFASSTNNVIDRVTLLIVGVMLVLIEYMLMIIKYHLQNRQKDDRIKTLEEEIELLKRKLSDENKHFLDRCKNIKANKIYSMQHDNLKLIS